jgi:hypothetical protein
MSVGALHVGFPDPGSVEIMAVPERVITHSEVEAQEILCGSSSNPSLPGSTEAGVVTTCHVGVAEVGSVEITVRSALSRATHSDVVGHEMPMSPELSTMAGALHVGIGTVGSVEITVRPASSMPTHSEVEGHAMSVRAVLSTVAGTPHVGVDAAGSVEITAWPRLSTATHSEAEEHETS